MAAKDLQIIPTRPVAPSETIAGGPADRTSGENPARFVLDILRRQWHLLLLVLVVSSATGVACSYYLGTEQVTAHNVLSQRSLPLTSSGVYVGPSPSAVVMMAESPTVLASVAAAEGLQSPHIVASRMRVYSSAGAGTVRVSFTMETEVAARRAISTLLTKVYDRIKKYREDSLQASMSHVTSLLEIALSEQDTARENVILARERVDQLAPDLLPQSARLQALVSRQLQIEHELRDAKRQRSRLDTDAVELIGRMRTIADEDIKTVVDARRRQLQALGQGLRSSTRTAALREQFLAELNDLVLPLETMTADGNGPEDEPDSASDIAQDQAPPIDSSQEGPAVDAAQGPGEVMFFDEARMIVQAFAESLFVINSVGGNLAGDFDAVALSVIQSGRSRLANFESQALSLRETMDDLDHTIDFLKETESQISDDINKARQEAQKENDGFVVSPNVLQAMTELMEREANVSLVGQRVSELRQRQTAITEAINCQELEYTAEEMASVDPEKDINSNHRKYFLFATFGTGCLLLLPVALFEWLRLRPAPVSVVSRRWNLPVLGIQSVTSGGKDFEQQRLTDTRHSLRLMALRIQQSLYHPNGKVVLFSGLDHDDSPLLLIREIAKCLSQREETCLILQTMPCQVELARRGRGDGERIGRPGVAEYLAGEFDEVGELVIKTGIAGVDFLPGGCTVTASEAMASGRLTSLVESLREKYSTILMCGPPTLNPADLQMVAARADGIVFTVTKQSLCGVYGEEVINDLIELGAPILGFAEQAARGKHQVPGLTTSEAELQLVKSLTP